MRVAAAWACALCLPAGWGQGEALEQGGSTSATVPASNEAMLLVSRVKQAIAQADWRLALALRERLVDLSSDLVPVPPGRTYYPVWRRAAELFDRLPPEGRALYRQLYDAELSARLREAAAAGDVAALRDLFRTYRGASAWPAVGAELVAQLVDRGRFGEAIETIQILAAADVPLTPARRAQLAVALARLGRWQAASAELAALEEDSAVRGRPEWEQRLAALQQWIAAERDRCLDATPVLDCSPALAAGARWQAPLEPAGPPGLYDDDATVADAVGFLRRLPLHRPVVEGDTLVVRLRGTIWAYDALTLMPRWRVRERQRGEYKGKNEAWPVALFTGPVPDRDPEDPVSRDAHLLLSHALRHSISTGFGLVFTIEDLPVPMGTTSDAVGGLWEDPAAVSASNELVARELLTGRLAWRRGHEPADPLFAAAFQDCPVVVGEHLCVPFVRGNELGLCLLDPATGQTVRAVPVVGPPTFFTSQGGRCLLAGDEASLYVCTGNGVVAAFSRADLSWRWATTYPSTLGDRRSAVWWAPREELREFGVDRPVVAGDLLVLAPIDCPFIFALERFGGGERWRRERGAYSYLVGAVTAGVLLGGDGIACLDAADGRTLRWRSVPLQVTGQPAVSGEHVFVPTRDGIVVLDGRTGKVLIEPACLAARGLPEVEPNSLAASHSGYRLASLSPRDLASANLVPAGTALFAVSPNFVVKYADVAATRRWCAALRADEVTSPRAQLADAWLDVLTGHYGEALAGLDRLHPTDTTLAAARERLLTDIFVSLSTESPGGPERLAWLRRAAVLASSAEVAAQLAVLIGRALEDSGAWGEAIRHYGELLDGGQTALVSDARDPDRQIAVWLHAVARLRAGLSGSLAAERDAWLHECLAAASPELLQRLQLVSAEPTWRQQIDAALALAPLPPELLIEYVPPDDDVEQPLDYRRRLHLARWETHVALGLREAAQADRRYWHEHFAPLAAQPNLAEAGAVTGEAQRARRIETSLAKLEDAAGQPFDRALTGGYRWKLPGAELIIDRRRPTTGMRSWIPVRKLEDRLICLHSAVLGRQWQQTVDALERGPGGDAAMYDAAQALVGGRDYQEEEPREVWPAAIHGHLAAVPVRGGLVGLGLGPERGAGRRLWEHPIPEWVGVPTRFAETALAGPHGVYVTRRHDRIALLGWSDGRIWWQRELPGLHIQQLFLVDERLVLFGRDGEVVSVGALFGDQPRVLAPTGGTARAVAAVGDTVVVWSEEAVAGFDPHAWERRWVRPCRAVEAWQRVWPGNWLAYRERDSEQWELLDAHSGEPLFAHGLGQLSATVTAAVLDGRWLLVAGFDRTSVDEEMIPAVRLVAFDRTSGERCWERQVKTLARVNATQLLAHAELIPLLVARSAYEFADPREYSTLAIQLIDKQTGELSATISIGDDFQGGGGVCGAYLLATDTRIIVQAGGGLVAYGSAGTRAEP